MTFDDRIGRTIENFDLVSNDAARFRWKFHKTTERAPLSRFQREFRSRNRTFLRTKLSVLRLITELITSAYARPDA